MNVLGNLKVLLEYILRNKQAQAKIVLSDDGTTPTDQTFKLPAFDAANVDVDSGSDEDVLVAENKTQTLKNKSINADPDLVTGDGNVIANIKDVSIAADADINASKLLDKSITFPKLEDDLYVGDQGVDITGNIIGVKLDEGIVTVSSTELVLNHPTSTSFNGTYTFLGSGDINKGGKTLYSKPFGDYAVYSREEGSANWMIAYDTQSKNFWCIYVGSQKPSEMVDWNETKNTGFSNNGQLEFESDIEETQNGKLSPVESYITY